MRSLVLISILSILGCSTNQKIVEQNGKQKIIFSLGNFSGIDYIMITTKSGGERKLLIKIDCNHYITDLGKILYMTKTTYGTSEKEYHVSFYVKDTIVLSKMSFAPRRIERANFPKLSDEEYNLIKSAFLNYPSLAKKYNLNGNVL